MLIQKITPFSYFLTKTYAVGAHWKYLIETLNPLTPQQMCLWCNKKNISNFRFEPVHEIFNNVVCAISKASDQPVHTSSLI